VITKEAE